MTALVHAARRLFAEHGYVGVGTEEIVREAGVTRGALYHHFRGGKADLLGAVAVEISTETEQRMALAASAAADPWDALVAATDAYLDACSTPEIERIIFLDGPSVLDWEDWRDHDADGPRRLLERTVQQAIDAGEIAPQSAALLTHVLIGALQEAARAVGRSGGDPTVREDVGRAVDGLMSGLHRVGG